MQRNRLEVVGYLATKPALRYLPSGTPVANVRLGKVTIQDGDGKPQQHTNWHNLSFYGDLSRVATTFEKGDNIFIEAPSSSGSSRRRATACNESSMKSLSGTAT